MEGEREGGRKQIGWSVRDCGKRPRHTLVVINCKGDTFIFCESLLVDMLGLCWAEELSSQQHQPGWQTPSSPWELFWRHFGENQACSLWDIQWSDINSCLRGARSEPSTRHHFGFSYHQQRDNMPPTPHETTIPKQSLFYDFPKLLSHFCGTNVTWHMTVWICWTH